MQDVLGQIGASDIPTVTVFNKIDVVADDDSGELEHMRELYEDALFVSAKTGQGIDTLSSRLSREIESRYKQISVCIPYDMGRYVTIAHEQGTILAQRYEEDGIYMGLRLNAALAQQFQRFEIEDEVTA